VNGAEGYQRFEMPRNKLKKYAELDTFENVFKYPDSLAGNWHKNYFKNDNPITLELGCGTGQMSLALARLFPERNYIGIDNKGARLWVGARTALDESLTNTAFIYTHIEAITRFFAPGEVDSIWITFPDPYPKPSKSNKRLTSPEFLSLYRQVASPHCIINFKTDDEALFAFTLRTAREQNLKIHALNRDIHSGNDLPDTVKIKTVYENRHLDEGKTIKFASYNLFPAD
jgi:tRNA (guanine-N7-)-methyltransferase